MGEVGLALFAQTALEVMQEALPACGSKFSKRTFTQPQLMTVLCLMRFVRRMTDEMLNDMLLAAPCLMPRPQGRNGKKTGVAVEATGLATGSISTFFINRRTDCGAGLPWKHWTKWTIVIDILRRCMLPQAARQGPYNYCASLSAARRTGRSKVSGRSCARAFTGSAIVSARRSGASSRQSNVSCRPRLRDVLLRRNAHRPCCWARPTTSSGCSCVFSSVIFLGLATEPDRC